MRKKYAIFDVDGTLADSMRYWDRLAEDYLGRLGIPASREDFAPIETMTMSESSAYFIQRYHLAKTPEKVMAEMFSLIRRHYEEDIPLKEGAACYLKRLRDRGVRMCVATANDAALSQACFRRNGILSYFDFFVSCDEIGRGKRDPYIYDFCRDRMAREAGTSLLPSDVAVFEDATYCLETASGAGYYTVAKFERSYEKDWERIRGIADESYVSWKDAV
ncbi:MAG: HAD family hydrolase [Bilifractor sp.]|jgi:HAD superfamily hydrolase (TIGR01509 family)